MTWRWIAFIVCIGGPAAARAAAFGPLVGQPVLAVAVGGPVVAVMVDGDRGRQVVLLARDPTLPAAAGARWPDTAARASTAADHRAARRRRREADVDDVIALYDLGDADRDTPELEDLLDDEGVDDPPARDRAPPPAPTSPLAPTALAAAGGHIWMASTRGVWLLDTSGEGGRWQPRGLSDRSVALIAAAVTVGGQTVIGSVASDDTVWMSDDDGGHWTLAGIATMRPRALAVAPDGRTLLLAGEEGLVGMRPRQAPWRIGERQDDVGRDDVVVCDGRVVALGHGTVAVFGDGIDHLPTRTPDVAARAIRCPAVGRGPWIGVAAGGLVSAAGGAAWAAIGDGALEVSAAAIADGEVWLGTPRGLYVGVPARAAPATNWAATDNLDRDEAALRRRPLATPPPWINYLPRVSVLGGLDVGDGRRTVQALLLLTVPLGRVPAAPPSALAAEIARRRARAAAGARDQAQLDRRAVETIAETADEIDQSNSPSPSPPPR